MGLEGSRNTSRAQQENGTVLEPETPCKYKAHETEQATEKLEKAPVSHTLHIPVTEHGR